MSFIKNKGLMQTSKIINTQQVVVDQPIEKKYPYFDVKEIIIEILSYISNDIDHIHKCGLINKIWLDATVSKLLPYPRLERECSLHIIAQIKNIVNTITPVHEYDLFSLFSDQIPIRREVYTWCQERVNKRYYIKVNRLQNDKRICTLSNAIKDTHVFTVNGGPIYEKYYNAFDKLSDGLKKEFSFYIQEEIFCEYGNNYCLQKCSEDHKFHHYHYDVYLKGFSVTHMPYSHSDLVTKKIAEVIFKKLSKINCSGKRGGCNLQ